MILENIRVSTLAAANALMEDKGYRAALLSISGSESRHAAVTISMVPNQNPWNTAYETLLSMNQTYTPLTPYMQCPPPTPLYSPPTCTPHPHSPSPRARHPRSPSTSCSRRRLRPSVRLRACSWRGSLVWGLSAVFNREPMGG